MLFNSFEFLLFFPIVTILFYLIPHTYRWTMLLAASCVFYMWFIPKYILILLITIAIDYVAGILIEKRLERGENARLYLIVSILSTCSVLFVFKYLNFCSENLVELARYFGLSHPTKVLHIILPIGLSFHTFQSLSYVIEVYNRRQKAEYHFGYYSLYVMFFPQLVTGPIERPQNLLRQLHEEKQLRYENVANGLRLILFGLFLKMVVADNLGTYVDKIYAAPQDYSSLDILLGMVSYSFQIYGDFFGYSTIALGCALLMGFTLIDNFKTPYLSESIQEFWRRWHISLSSWFRDYVYIPLGGNRVTIPRWMLNTLIVFTVCGIWHGANWTFMIWGFLYGVILVIEKYIRKLDRSQNIENQSLRQVAKGVKILITFSIVTLLWSIFRAPTFENLHQVFSALFHNGGMPNNLHIDIITYLVLLLFIVLDIAIRKTRFDQWCGNQNMVVRWLCYSVLLFAIFAYSSVIQYPFIYFQF